MSQGPMAGPLTIGEIFLSKYEIRALIGRGGYACVYHAVNSFLGRHVAIKVLHRAGGVDRESLRRGQAEAQLLSRLRHPNIVDVSDAGLTEQGLLYIVMELLEGRSLRDVLVELGSLSVEEALQIAIQVADGLEAAHSTGAIHRDLKPENIFITKGAEAKILDFGIAKIAGAAVWTTDQEVVHGTVLYMSPEQLQLAKITPRSDIFSLAATLYEALAGRHPVSLLVDAAAPNVWQISQAIMTLDPPLLDEVDARIPRGLALIVQRALARNPDERFASMAEFARALRECREAWLAYSRVHGLPVSVRELSKPGGAASGLAPSAWPNAPSALAEREPARAPSAPPPAQAAPVASAQKLVTPGSVVPVTSRRVRRSADAAGDRVIGVRQVLAVAGVVGVALGGVIAFWKHSQASHAARGSDDVAVSAAVPSSAAPVPRTADPPGSAAAPAFSAAEPAPPAASGPAPVNSPAVTGAQRTTSRAPRPARSVASPEKPSPKAKGTGDAVEERLRRLEKSLELGE